MSITRGLHHAALKVDVSLFDSVVKFYKDVFELTEHKTMGEGKDAAVQLASEGAILEIFANGSLDLPKDSVVAHIGFWVDDFDTVCERITAAGGTITFPPTERVMPSNPPTNAKICFYRGLAGELCELYSEK